MAGGTHVNNFLQVLCRHKHRLKFSLVEAVFDGSVAHRVVEADDGGLADHGREHSCVPLPPVLGPNSTECPLLAVLVDTFNGLEQSQLFTSFRNRFILLEHLLECLPLILAERPVLVLSPRAQESAIRPVTNLVQKDFQDALSRALQLR